MAEYSHSDHTDGVYVDLTGGHLLCERVFHTWLEWKIGLSTGSQVCQLEMSLEISSLFCPLLETTDFEEMLLAFFTVKYSDSHFFLMEMCIICITSEFWR